MQAGDRIGQYEVQGLIGRGGMAEVYKAWQTDLQRYEALKVPLAQPGAVENQDMMDRFLREARISANLKHPNIVTIHGVSGDDATQPYFAMEYIEGKDLSDFLKERGKLSLDEALPIIRQIAEALDYAHRKVYFDDKGRQKKGIIHRDIKPSNIFLEQDGKGGWKITLMDFGIAKAQEDEGGTHLTKAGTIAGTPEYMSPEQAQSSDLVNNRSDIYSFGIVVYEMLTGNPPFRAEQNTSPISVLLKHAQEEPKPPIQSAPDLSPKANAAILKVLSKKPLDRFDSCAAFVEALSPRVGVPKVNWLPMGIGGVVLVAVVAAMILMRKPPKPPACDTAAQCNIAACATSAFCQDIKHQNQSRANANQAKDIIDGNATKSIATYQNAEQLAQEGVRLWPQNENAWVQQCRAEYYIALQNRQFDEVSTSVKQAIMKFPENQDISKVNKEVADKIQSIKDAEKAENINEQYSAERADLMSKGKTNQISRNEYLKRNNELNKQFRKAEKIAHEGVNLWQSNDDAWAQYCIAGFYLATTKANMKQVLKRIQKAKQMCPGSSKFKLVEASARGSL